MKVIFNSRLELFETLLGVGVTPVESSRLTSAIFSVAGVKVVQHQGSDRHRHINGLRDDHPSLTASERNE